MEFDKSRVFSAVNADEFKVGIIEMNTTEQILNVGNKKCEKNCPVHGLVTHNSCMFCDALRDSPYVEACLKTMSDKQILAIQKDLEEEWG